MSHRRTQSGFHSKHNSDLFDAVAAGNTKKVKELLNLGAQCDFRVDEWTPLMKCCVGGHLDIARELIAKKADVNALNKSLWSPLHIASYNGHLKLVQLLLSKKAAIEVCDDMNWTPLIAASIRGHAPVVQELLKNKADVFQLTSANTSAQILARNEEHYHVAELLQQEEDRQRPLFEERIRQTKQDLHHRERLERLSMIENNPNDEVVGRKELEHVNELLWQGASRGNLESIRRAIDQGASPLYKGQHPHDAIEAARRSGNRRCQAYLQSLVLTQRHPDAKLWDIDQTLLYIEGSLPLHIPSHHIRQQIMSYNMAHPFQYRCDIDGNDSNQHGANSGFHHQSNDHDEHCILVDGPINGVVLTSPKFHAIIDSFVNLTTEERTYLHNAAFCIRHGFPSNYHIKAMALRYARQFESEDTSLDLTSFEEVKRYLHLFRGICTSAQNMAQSTGESFPFVCVLMTGKTAPVSISANNTLSNKQRLDELISRLRWWRNIEYELVTCSNAGCSRCRTDIISLPLQSLLDTSSPVASDTANNNNNNTTKTKTNLAFTFSDDHDKESRRVSAKGSSSGAHPTVIVSPTAGRASFSPVSPTNAAGAAVAPGSPTSVGTNVEIPNGYFHSRKASTHGIPDSTQHRTNYAFAQAYEHLIASTTKGATVPKCGYRLKTPQTSHSYRLHLLCDGLISLPALCSSYRRSLQPCSASHRGFQITLTNAQLLRFAPYLIYSNWLLGLNSFASTALMMIRGRLDKYPVLPQPDATSGGASGSGSSSSSSATSALSPSLIRASSNSGGGSGVSEGQKATTTPGTGDNTADDGSTPRNYGGLPAPTKPIFRLAKKLYQTPPITPSFIPPVRKALFSVKSRFMTWSIADFEPKPLPKPDLSRYKCMSFFPIIIPQELVARHNKEVEESIAQQEQEQEPLITIQPPRQKSAAWNALQKAMSEKKLVPTLNKLKYDEHGNALSSTSSTGETKPSTKGVDSSTPLTKDNVSIAPASTTLTAPIEQSSSSSSSSIQGTSTKTNETAPTSSQATSTTLQTPSLGESTTASTSSTTQDDTQHSDASTETSDILSTPVKVRPLPANLPSVDQDAKATQLFQQTEPEQRPSLVLPRVTESLTLRLSSETGEPVDPEVEDMSRTIAQLSDRQQQLLQSVVAVLAKSPQKSKKESQGDDENGEGPTPSPSPSPSPRNQSSPHDGSSSTTTSSSSVLAATPMKRRPSRQELATFELLPSADGTMDPSQAASGAAARRRQSSSDYHRQDYLLLGDRVLRDVEVLCEANSEQVTTDIFLKLRDQLPLEKCLLSSANFSGLDYEINWMSELFTCVDAIGLRAYCADLGNIPLMFTFFSTFSGEFSTSSKLVSASSVLGLSTTGSDASNPATTAATATVTPIVIHASDGGKSSASPTASQQDATTSKTKAANPATGADGSSRGPGGRRQSTTAMITTTAVDSHGNDVIDTYLHTNMLSSLFLKSRATIFDVIGKLPSAERWKPPKNTADLCPVQDTAESCVLWMCHRHAQVGSELESARFKSMNPRDIHDKKCTIM